MRKNFLGTLLMGALITASVGTFTSCKDYDDDINNLQTQIDGLRKSLDEIKKLIESGSVITSVAPINNGVKVTMSNGKTFEITNGKDGANGTVWTINEQGYWVKDGQVTEYKALGKDGAKGDKGEAGPKGDKGDKGEAGPKGDKGDKGEAGKYYVPNAQTGKFDLVENGKTTPTDISFLAPGTITAVKDADFLKLFNVKGAESDPVVISLTNSLKSLVFVPDFYYDGIQAFDFNTFTFNAKTVNKVNADGEFADDKPTVGEEVVSSPDLAATYHLNPTNAKMKEDLAKYSFIAFNKDYTRAGADVSSAFTMKSVDLSKTGYATVHASYNGKVIKSIGTDDQVTVLALQYTDDDNATVTSDYAAVRANTYTGLVLNNPKYAPQKDEIPSWLYQTAKTAIDNDATVTLAWNNDKGIDLREYVNTRYQYMKADRPVGAYSNWDKNAAEGKVEKSGYKYTFELVGWHDGKNKTSASAHAAIAKDGFTLRAQMPKDGKQQAYAYSEEEGKKNNEQNQATIDREPLVRVILTDTVNAKIAAVGYIKIKIVAPQDIPTDPKLYTHEVAVVDKDYTIACGDEDVLDLKLKWYEVEEPIIAKLNMSKTDFEANYKLDDSNNDALQFNAPTANATPATEKVGVIAQTKTDIEGTMTEVLKWTVKNQQAWEAFKEGKTTLSTYVRYKKIGNKGMYDYFYVKFTWTPKKINITPETNFGDANKIKNYWYASNSNIGGSGYDDIHGNVEVVGSTNNTVMNGAVTPAADDEYVFNIKNALVGNKLTVDPLKAPYAALNAGLNLKFAFVTGKGLYANEDGTKVYAEKAKTNEVASIDPTTGVVTYSKNETALKLLNAYDHSDLANTVTAVVEVKVSICGNTAVPVKNSKFNVKFLRPVDVKNATAEFTDAETNGSTSDLHLTFMDWRDHDFTDATKTKGENYWKYYGVESIDLDIANAETNLNGSMKKLSDVTKKLKFTYNGPQSAAEIQAGKFGTITYENNGLTVASFIVNIPAKIKYHWGTINVTVKCTVGKTQNNAKRH
ncbi:PL29 family lyase N-terminal domain-containing protein [Hoylesella timonensis]|uniref:PL29 family lyase N-terminal domain-containing protein n=1 Tax=Hoylesella timonensis TaxID=386414 RepID=UPI00242A3BA1|nr:PL29 family lyase N-terminal domain-containing protein [Hoylesella timonensis]